MCGRINDEFTNLNVSYARKYFLRQRRDGRNLHILRRQKKAQLLAEYLQGRHCDDCSTTDIRVLQFDHKDPTTKKAKVSRLMISQVSWNRVLEEISKCNLVCANCHAIRTSQQQKWRKMEIDFGASRQLLSQNASAIWGRRLREVNIKELVNYLNAHPCVDCGIADIRVLQFDHKSRNRKSGNIGVIISKQEWPVVLNEIKKCRVVCANCHTIRTSRSFHWTKYLVAKGGI